MAIDEGERWQPVPVPLGDGRHDIGDDARAAIFHRLHDDFTLAAPWMTADQRRHLAMFAAASVRALLHELGTLRDLVTGEAQPAREAEGVVGESEPVTPDSDRTRSAIATPHGGTDTDAPVAQCGWDAQGRAERERGAAADASPVDAPVGER